MLQRAWLWVQLPEGVADGGGTAVGISTLNFLLASSTGFSNWVFWLMWLHKEDNNIDEQEL